MSGGIQQSITTLPAPGIVGSFADNNPRYMGLFGQGGAVAGPLGLTIGLFAWSSYTTVDGDFAPAALNNYGSGPIAGFVGREMQALNTTYLSDAGETIPAGFQADVFTAGGFWVKNNGTTVALPGMKAYANFSNGQASFAPPGNPSTASATASTISAGTAATFTGSIVGNILTVTGAVTNTIYPGAVLSGTGVTTGTVITSQLSGTTGGAGTYALNVGEQSVSAESLTATPYVLNASGGTITGTISLGAVVQSAGGTVTGTVIGYSVTMLNTPSANEFIVQPPTLSAGTVTSGTITLATNVETSWYARSMGAPGEIVKISNLPGVG